jgi:hypothetical protein
MVGFHMQIIIKIYISIRFGPDTGTPFMARKLVVLTHTIVLANISCLNFSTSYKCTCKHYEYEFQLIPNVTQDVYFGPLFFNCTYKHFMYEFQLILYVTQDVYFSPLFFNSILPPKKNI